MEEYLEINRKGWDARTRIHLDSSFYDVPGFLAGKSSLNEIELDALGDEVKDKSLLHLQCHFGLDTLSWARLGAEVTGLDLSTEAVNQAREMASKAGLAAEFVCADVYSARQELQHEFDIVFSSYGVLCWLPDLDKWAQTIATSLKPGGTFLLAEFHPVQALLEGYSYFNQPEPDMQQEATYTENAGADSELLATWFHSVSEVINALLKAGLQLVEFKEYDFSPYNCFEGLVDAGDGKYMMKHGEQAVPLVYRIRAVRP
ncbi:MAG: class I SAM-dependent methyltransferase [Shewanella sp.]|nr:class I SAM-dependent methyltransferase [Shewanella sp.]